MAEEISITMKDNHGDYMEAIITPFDRAPYGENDCIVEEIYYQDYVDYSDMYTLLDDYTMDNEGHWLWINPGDLDHRTGRVYISPEDKGPVVINFNKEVEIDLSGIEEGYYLEIATRDIACSADCKGSIWKSFPIVHISFEDADYWWEEKSGEVLLPEEFDEYALYITTDVGPNIIDGIYGYVELNDGDSIAVKGRQPYLNGEPVEEYQSDADATCFTFSGGRYETTEDVVGNDTGEAIENATGLEPQVSCPEGYNVINNRCIPEKCTSDNECIPGQFCDLKKGVCTTNTCETEQDCPFEQVCIENQCTYPSVIIVMHGAYGQYSANDVEAMKDDIMDDFTENLEIGKCSEKLKVIVAEGCKDIIYNEKDGEVCSETNMEKVDDCFDIHMKDLLNLNVSRLIVLGLMKEEVDDGVPGRTCRSRTRYPTIFAQYNDEGRFVPVHEMGHAFGLLDQYCYNPPGNLHCNPAINCSINPTDPALDGDDQGILEEIVSLLSDEYCEERFGHSMRVLGNKWNYPYEGRSFMGSYEAPGPRGWDKNERKYLDSLPELQCD